MMGDLREIQQEPDINPEASFLWRRAICGATWAEAQKLGDDTILRQLLEKVGVAATTLRPTSNFRR
jgi:hypothetical protein